MSAYEATEARRQRGIQLAETCGTFRQKDGAWIVPSQKGQGRYSVNLAPADPSVPMCTCKDFAERGEPCKHVFAVKYVLERETLPDGTETVRETFSITKTTVKRPTYRQNWPAYNAAQTNEKPRLQALLDSLCYGIVEPRADPRGGRPTVPLRDVVFAATCKVYSMISGRRFMGDMEEAHAKGYLSRPVHYNSISKYLESPALTPILKSLIVEASKPLASVEVDFAGDSSGFTTSRFIRWYDHKYGVVRQQHDWVKVHLMCGVKTNVVTAVEIKERAASDPVQLPAMVKQTRENFTMREVSLDKVYASLENYRVIDEAGAVPYIPFKSIHTGAGGGLWAKMYHYYNFNREDFLNHYHKRSNAESTFSMIKAKFGDAVRSKTDTAMTNEVLCKILCHNLCRLIHSHYELGIEATFWNDKETAPAEPTPEPAGDLIDAYAWV